MAIARKEVEGILILMQFFSYSRKQGWFFSCVHLFTSDKKYYRMKITDEKCTGMPMFSMSNSTSCSVQDEDIWSHFHTMVRYKKLLKIKHKFISAMKDISLFSRKCEMY